MTLSILDMRLTVISELPDTKDILVEKLMLDGIQDLCRETSCLIDPFTTTSVNSQAVYPLTITGSLPANTEIIGFWQGKYDGATLPDTSNNEMDQRDRKWEERIGSPTGIIYDGGTNIRYNITPDTTGKAVQLEPILMPDSVDGVVPEKIEKRHQEAVKSYVKWKAYEAPGKLFNADLALYFRKDYERRRNRLKIEIMKDGVELEIQPQSFVTGRRRPGIGIGLQE
ncbi:hypothetical protein LCGC14_3136570 [marine sediment metagenome]|uniref:Uncharacterized protein n=1 Tax=marine sediment metagenome TaxID=412755 RepID=A0A0F8Y540_9ZZZZ